MNNTLYKRIFESVLEPSNPEIDPQLDADNFKQGFDQEEDFEGLDSELQDITLSEEEIEAVVQQSKIYNQKITGFISLLNKIQEDVLKGRYKNIQAKGLDKFSNIIKDLQELGTDLTAGVNDALIKKSQDN